MSFTISSATFSPSSNRPTSRRTTVYTQRQTRAQAPIRVVQREPSFLEKFQHWVQNAPSVLARQTQAKSTALLDAVTTEPAFLKSARRWVQNAPAALARQTQAGSAVLVQAATTEPAFVKSARQSLRNGIQAVGRQGQKTAAATARFAKARQTRQWTLGISAALGVAAAFDYRMKALLKSAASASQAAFEKAMDASRRNQEGKVEKWLPTAIVTVMSLLALRSQSLTNHTIQNARRTVV